MAKDLSRKLQDEEELLELTGEGKPKDRPTFGISEGRNNHGVFWLMHATMSVVTTKWLLSDRNVNDPNRLLFFHIWNALILCAIWRLSKTAGHEKIASLTAVLKPRRHPWKLRLWRFGYQSAVPGALIWGYQALIHYPNFPVLMMLISVELRLDLVYRAMSCRDCRLRTLAQYAMLLGCIVCIIANDYKLYSTGIIFAILAMLYAEAAKVAYSMVMSETPDIEGVTKSRELHLTGLLATLVPLLINIWVDNGFKLSFWHLLPDFSAMPTGVLFLNNYATSLALLLGGNTLTTFVPVWRKQKSDGSEDRENRTRVTSVAMVGTCSAIYLLVGRRTFISAWQILAFWFAAAVSLSLGTSWVGPTSFGADVFIRIASKAATTLASSTKDSLEATQAEHGSKVKAAQAEGRPTPRKPSKYLIFTAVVLTWFGRISLLVLPVLSWLLLIAWSVLGLPWSASHSSQQVLNSSYQPAGAFDVVVAHHSEPVQDIIDILGALTKIPRVAAIASTVYVYDKGTKLNHTDFSHQFRTQLSESGFKTAMILEGRSEGGDAETYLGHMVSKQTELANHTLFTPARFSDIRSLKQRIEDYFVPETGFLSLGSVDGFCADCEYCGDLTGWNDQRKPFIDVYRQVYNGSECKDLVLTQSNRFIASAARIRSGNKGLYGGLYNALTQSESVFHQQNYTQYVSHDRLTDTMEDPVFGRTMERMWGVLFHCSERRVAERCPSMLSGVFGRKGALEDCQCLDP